MQSFDDSQLASHERLQSLFLEADANGDGILSLDEFNDIVWKHQPGMSEAEIFALCVRSHFEPPSAITHTHS